MKRENDRICLLGILQCTWLIMQISVAGLLMAGTKYM